MAIKIGINGYGRIGRNVLRALYESGRADEFEVVAINDLGDAKTNAHLTRFDTAHGRFPGEVKAEENALIVNGDRIQVLGERDPANLPWGKLGVDVVMECTGLFSDSESAGAHLKAGAKKVVISAPAKSDDIKTIVYGVNHDIISADDQIISNASCTTNCLVPLVKPLHDAFGIEHGLMNTIHSYTNDQVLSDVYHKDIRRARSATENIIPTKTGAAAAVGKVLPDLDGKLDGFAVRVPTINVSFVDFSATVSRDVTVDEVNRVLQEAAQGELKGILAYTEEELVSSDYNHDPASSTVDAKLTKVAGKRFIKVCAWYDNEWAFSNRMLDTAKVLIDAS